MHAILVLVSFGHVKTAIFFKVRQWGTLVVIWRLWQWRAMCACIAWRPWLSVRLWSLVRRFTSSRTNLIFRTCIRITHCHWRQHDQSPAISLLLRFFWDTKVSHYLLKICVILKFLKSAQGSVFIYTSARVKISGSLIGVKLFTSYRTYALASTFTSFRISFEKVA